MSSKATPAAVEAPGKMTPPAPTPPQDAPPSLPPPAEPPRWAFGDPPLNAAMQANLVFGREINGRCNASGVFRRDGSPEPEPTDQTAALLTRGPRAVKQMDLAAPAALVAERGKLREVLALCGTKAADIAKRRAAPALLGALDFTEQVRQLAAEEDTVAARRKEATEALARVDHQLGWVRRRLEQDVRTALRPLPADLAEELHARRQALMREIAARAGALLEELLQIAVTERRPPDVEAAVRGLLAETGLRD